MIDLLPAQNYYSFKKIYFFAVDLSVTDLEYLEQNLRILSGFYGILRPFDGVIQYRLEMGAKLVGATYQEYSGVSLISKSELASCIFLAGEIIIFMFPIPIVLPKF